MTYKKIGGFKVSRDSYSNVRFGGKLTTTVEANLLLALLEEVEKVNASLLKIQDELYYADKRGE